MVRTVLFVLLNSITLFSCARNEVLRLEVGYGLTKIMCGWAPVPCAQQLGLCTIHNHHFPSYYAPLISPTMLKVSVAC